MSKRPVNVVLSILFGIVVVATTAAILFPIYAASRGVSRDSGCLSHVKQLGLTLLMYEADTGAMPFRDHWMDAAAGAPTSIRVCPFVEDEELQGFGYAFNSTLARKPLPTKDPETVPMVYDSINYGPNASDPFISLPNPGRHRGRNSIVYADGHSRSVTPRR